MMEDNEGPIRLQAAGIQGPTAITKPLGILERIALVMVALPGVEKKRKHPKKHYSYASHEDISDAIRPLFIARGIVQTVSVVSLSLVNSVVTLQARIRWSCADNPESFVEGDEWSIQPPAGAPDAAQVGAALSYAVKNFQLKNLMLGDGEPDSDAGHFEPSAPVDELTQQQGQDWLEAYDDCATFDAITLVGKRIQEWGKVDRIPGLRQKLVLAAQQAKKRVRGGA